jgi:putative FmdB family regulatory protein
VPIYEYECGACGHQFEAFQKSSEAILTDCPECHKTTLRKLISAGGFQLKGTGWYATDFKDKGKPPASQSSTHNASTTEQTTTKTGSEGSSSSSTSTDGKADKA